LIIVTLEQGKPIYKKWHKMWKKW